MRELLILLIFSLLKKVLINLIKQKFIKIFPERKQEIEDFFDFLDFLTFFTSNF